MPPSSSTNPEPPSWSSPSHHCATETAAASEPQSSKARRRGPGSSVQEWNGATGSRVELRHNGSEHRAAPGWGCPRHQGGLARVGTTSGLACPQLKLLKKQKAFFCIPTYFGTHGLRTGNGLYHSSVSGIEPIGDGTTVSGAAVACPRH